MLPYLLRLHRFNCSIILPFQVQVFLLKKAAASVGLELKMEGTYPRRITLMPDVALYKSGQVFTVFALENEAYRKATLVDWRTFELKVVALFKEWISENKAIIEAGQQSYQTEIPPTIFPYPFFHLTEVWEKQQQRKEQVTHTLKEIAGRHKIRELRAAFYQKSPPYLQQIFAQNKLTFIIVCLNFLVFGWMLHKADTGFWSSFTVLHLIESGGNLRSILVTGEWWRLITAGFIHSHFFHLLVNMVVLTFFSLFLEIRIGMKNLGLLYFLSLIFTPVFSLFASTGYDVAVGASGTVNALGGALLFFLFIGKPYFKLPWWLAILLVISFLGDLKSSDIQGVDNAAHLAGYLVGWWSALMLWPLLAFPKFQLAFPYQSKLALAITVLTLSVGLVLQIPQQQAYFSYYMENFYKNEDRALKLKRMGEQGNLSATRIAKVLNGKGMAYWDANLTLLKQAEALPLETNQQKRIKLLQEYCMLRKQSFALIVKALNSEHLNHKYELSQVNRKIENVILQIRSIE